MHRVNHAMMDKIDYDHGQTNGSPTNKKHGRTKRKLKFVENSQRDAVVSVQFGLFQSMFDFLTKRAKCVADYEKAFIETICLTNDEAYAKILENKSGELAELVRFRETGEI